MQQEQRDEEPRQDEEDIDPEEALRGANAKFTRRFQSIEAALHAQGRRPEDSTLAEMDALWDAAKAEERK